MKKIFFDLDGTLFQAHITVGIALENTLQEFQTVQKPDSDMIIRAVGLTTENFLKECFPQLQEVDKFKERFRYHEWAAVRESGRLFDGIEELLSWLMDRQYRMYVCSNGSMEYIELVTECMGIRKYFEELISSKGLSSKGVAIHPFLQPEDVCLIVGDTGTDRRGALELKIPFVAATYGYGSREELANAAFYASSPMEIKTYIESRKSLS